MYHFAGLAPASYRITAACAGFDALRLEVSVAPGQQLVVPQLTLHLGRNGDSGGLRPEYLRPLQPGTEGGRLSGTVTLLTAPSINAPSPQITACPQQGKCAVGRTDAEGRFAFDGLVPGRYRFNVIRDEYWTLNSEFSIEDGWETVYPVSLAKICARNCPEPPKPAALTVCE